MPHEMILTEQHGRVGVIKFNNERKLNALTGVMLSETRRQINDWNDDSSVGAIVITGQGRAFCAGADIGGWNKQIEQQEGNGAQQPRGRPAEREETWTELIIRSKPVVCAINGPAIGAGLTITLPADVRIASPQARLSMRFIRVGVMPELASTFILPHIVGLGNALGAEPDRARIGRSAADRSGPGQPPCAHLRLLCPRHPWTPPECGYSSEITVAAGLRHPDAAGRQRRHRRR